MSAASPFQAGVDCQGSLFWRRRTRDWPLLAGDPVTAGIRVNRCSASLAIAASSAMVVVIAKRHCSAPHPVLDLHLKAVASQAFGLVHLPNRCDSLVDRAHLVLAGPLSLTAQLLGRALGLRNLTAGQLAEALFHRTAGLTHGPLRLAQVQAAVSMTRHT